MSQELFIKRYKTNYLGPMILMLSLEGFQKILPHVFLNLDDPQAFQQACFNATKDVPAAYYDEDAIGWHQWWHEIGDNFSKHILYEIDQPDRNRVLHWLENGNPCQTHGFAHRKFWGAACTWGYKSGEVAQYFTGNEINIIHDFSEAVFKEKISEDYSDIKEEIASDPESYFDTWQKTKFHIYIIPEVLISNAFIPLNWMRTAHILKKHTDAYIARDGDPDILERMVIKYAELNETSPWTQKYVDDKAAFKIKNLWSNRFQEQIL